MKIFWRVVLILIGILVILQAISIVQSYNLCQSRFSGSHEKHNCLPEAIFRIDVFKITN